MPTPRGWRGNGRQAVSRRANATAGATSFVYFVQAADGGPVKIGRSRRPTERLAELQTHHHEELRLRRVVPLHESKASTLERNLHRHFDYARLRGEWFSPVPELHKLGRLAGPVADDPRDPGLSRLAQAIG